MLSRLRRLQPQHLYVKQRTQARNFLRDADKKPLPQIVREAAACGVRNRGFRATTSSTCSTAAASRASATT